MIRQWRSKTLEFTTQQESLTTALYQVYQFESDTPYYFLPPLLLA